MSSQLYYWSSPLIQFVYEVDLGPSVTEFADSNESLQSSFSLALTSGSPFYRIFSQKHMDMLLNIFSLHNSLPINRQEILEENCEEPVSKTHRFKMMQWYKTQHPDSELMTLEAIYGQYDKIIQTALNNVQSNRYENA